MTIRWFYYAAPQTFYGLAGRMWPWFAALAGLLALAGLWIGFGVAPTMPNKARATASSLSMSPRLGCP